MGFTITIISVFLFIKWAACATGTCSFNTMCSCKLEGNLQKQHTDMEVSCVGVPFAKVPDFPYSHMKIVSIVGCGLEVILADSFGDMKTNVLSLMSNNIVDIHDQAFLNMYNTLEYLDVSFNNLQEVPFAPLKTSERLKVINLESNEIVNLPVSWMQVKETLVALYLGGNDLFVLPSNIDFSLQSFKNLSQIYLDRNYLTQIQENALPFTAQVLSVSDNLLTEVPFKLIEILPDLTQFYLKNNYITEIPNIPFTKKRIFVALDLSYNFLKSITTLFFRSVQIKDLNLQGNHIETITPAIFNGVSCNKIDLSYNRLDSLADRTFYGLENTLNYLDLSHNNFTKIPKAVFGLKHIRTLILDYNEMSNNYSENFLKNCSQSIRSLSLVGTGMRVFPRNILKNTRRLVLLNLSNNFIEEIDENDFFKWGENLETLYLTSNNIKALKDRTFKLLNRLEKLYLAYNEIERVEDKAFMNLERITTLDMSFGLKMNAFPEVALKPLSSLLYLALTGNNISTLPPTALYDFHYLQYLILDFNKIVEIPENFFHPKVHRYLKDIRMSFNELLSIAPNTFSGLDELQNIILNDNQISFIHEGSFKNLPNILRVSLSNNHISKLTAQAFINIPNLIQLDLQNNELNEFSFNIFQNVTNILQPMSINLSRNYIDNIYASEVMTSLYLKNFDLSHNKLTSIPQNLMISIKDSMRRLDLSHNQIRIVEGDVFSNTKSLEYLSLKSNNLISLKPGSFRGLRKLQILDLSSNHMEFLHPKQFENLENLRILDLSQNALRSLTDDAFHNTKIEKLILSNNIFVLLPSAPFADITYSLRVVDFSHNQIEQLSRDLFSAMPSVNEINLCHNKLTHIHPTEFKHSMSLVKLELCSNKLSSVNRQLFHNMQNLRYLNLADTNLNEVPVINIPNLVALNISHNRIQKLSESFLSGLPKLRHLDLSHNELPTVSGVSWHYSPNLKSLNFSNNPIKILTKDSFSGLSNLIHLDIQKLDHLERFDSDSLQECKMIKSLRVQTWPKIEKYRFRLARIISTLKSLKHLSVLVTEDKLTDQLIQAFPKKLNSLEITGENLQLIGENSLEGLERSGELSLRISGTKISHFPRRFFWNMKYNKFSVDLSDNQMRDVDPEIFYEKDGMQKYGTSIYSGGINLKGNPISCDCNSVWFSDWMKRYMFESVKVNFNEQQEEEMKSLLCVPPSNGQLTPLLTYHRPGCHYVFGSKASINRVERTLLVTAVVLVNLLALH
ncbi:chaoptin [Halyomorpha halys]|uniref:chaoptin n=1 Tax=Halyomorpha halys TaxID=286706 RepID=UPI0006D4FF23|nr:chaoptin [Halyomorpha halys]